MSYGLGMQALLCVVESMARSGMKIFVFMAWA
jgi:hypothetical protein